MNPGSLNGHHLNGFHHPMLEEPPDKPAPAEEHPPAIPELAGVLSPSQVATFVTCSVKWWYKYGLQLEDIQGSARGVGKALHSALRENFEQKIETKEDLPVEGVLAVFDEAWSDESKQTQFEKDEDRDQVRAMGRACAAKFMEQSAPLIDPAAVELKVEGNIGGVPVRGYVDILDVHGCIIDFKSAKSSPAKGVVRPDYRFQVTTYYPITPGASGKARLDTVVKLKREVKHVSQPFTVTPADLEHVERMYPLVQEAMRSGLFWPNRNHFLCSRKYCAHWQRCESDYGGVVSGGPV